MLGKKIKKIAKSSRILYTTPSHDRTSFVIPDVADFIGRKLFKHDLSEINDLDNLAEPEEDILNSMKRSADLIGVSDLFYLINGSSSGIIAAMSAVLSPNDKVLIARNCHKSVINGLILTGAEPIWFLPEFNFEWSVFNPVSDILVDEFLSKNPEIKAVIITSPTYEGICSDISAIAKVCRKYNAVLIIDEAHGALKSFAPEYFGDNAVKLGADIAVQSLHKTCGAPNPCAILISNGTVCRDEIQNALNLINTSSPSYPMLATIEAVINYLCSDNGKLKIKKLIDNISSLKQVFQNRDDIIFYDKNDITKLFIKVKGLSGFDLSDILFDEFNIEDELANNSASLLLTGIGTSKHKLKLLEKALTSILTTNYSYPKELPLPPLLISDIGMIPRDAFFTAHTHISIENSLGRICAESVVEYPPGIPVILPGEKISAEHIRYFSSKLKLIKVVG